MRRVELVDVGKRYVKYEDTPMLVGALRLRARTRRSRLWALRHVGLDVADSECVGVIGRNGSGKSTMLRLLAGVTAPTEGRVAVLGRVAPLIAVGVGFHPELTGRENVHVNATVLGLSRQEIERRFDDIVAFAEIGDFIDTPVKFYSSGMFVRLGFAVAVMAEPDVLLVDEVLAVGDFAFQIKCHDRMQEIRKAGTTIVVVSHNLTAIRTLCPRTLVLHDGEVRHLGATDDAISLYHQLLGEQREPDAPTDGDQRAQRVDIAADIAALELVGPTGATAHIHAGDDVRFLAAITFHRPVEDPIVGFSIADASGVTVYADSTPWRDGLAPVPAGRRQFEVGLRAALPTGSYAAEVSLRSGDGVTTLAASPTPLAFYVAGRRRVTGVSDLEGTFSLEALSDAEIPGPPHEDRRATPASPPLDRRD